MFLVFAGVMFIAILSWAVPLRLWLEAFASGVRVGLGNLIGMRLRKVSPPEIIRPLIAASKAGISLSTDLLEAHYLAGGDVRRVVNALISADKASIDLPFQQAAAIDLAGRDVLEAVQVSVNPKVINTPKVAAMAKDGIQ
ncbi:MAG: flotillin-like FloA family protein, partial [Gemmatimonadota bacterium]